MRSRKEGFGGGAKKAMKKGESVVAVIEGDEGVTMMAGRGDFSVTRDRDKSAGTLGLPGRCKGVSYQGVPGSEYNLDAEVNGGCGQLYRQMSGENSDI
jgi:hypothetical protein